MMVRHVFTNKAVFHDGDTELVPGLTLHRVGGHSAGLQIARVWTKRGWVVVASDASHLYASVQTSAGPFPVVYNVAEMLEEHNTLYRTGRFAGPHCAGTRSAGDEVLPGP